MYMRRALRKHNIFIDGIGTDVSEELKTSSEKAAAWINENQLEIKKIIMESGLEDQIISWKESMGLGFANTKKMSTIDNLTISNPKILGSGQMALSRAKGYYKHQAIKSFNPIFWVELVVFLPKEIVSFTGLKSEKKSFLLTLNFVQLIYWGLSIFYTIKLIIKN